MRSSSLFFTLLYFFGYKKTEKNETPFLVLYLIICGQHVVVYNGLIYFNRYCPN